jgi:hypothetical protein
MISMIKIMSFYPFAIFKINLKLLASLTTCIKSWCKVIRYFYTARIFPGIANNFVRVKNKQVLMTEIYLYCII